MAPSCPSSSGRRTRLLVVEVKSATLKTEKKGPFYVKLWIFSGGKKLETGKVYGSKPVWNEKFVFEVPRTFVADQNTPVWFEVFHERKFLDKSLGKAQEKFELEKIEEKSTTGDDNEDEANYDTENEYFSPGEREEERKGEEEDQESKQEKSCRLKGSGSVCVAKGELKVEMVVQDYSMRRVGNTGKRGVYMAMGYDEFMGRKEVTEGKKTKSHSLMCFGNSTTKD